MEFRSRRSKVSCRRFHRCSLDKISLGGSWRTSTWLIFVSFSIFPQTHYHCFSADALHLAHLIASHGYLFQIDDHVLTVKNDGTFYRFQTPYFWPSNCWDPENTDYGKQNQPLYLWAYPLAAVYLCKRTMQNKAHLELEDFEAENLAKLQKMFSRKWEFVFMQAEAQYKFVICSRLFFQIAQQRLSFQLIHLHCVNACVCVNDVGTGEDIVMFQFPKKWLTIRQCPDEEINRGTLRTSCISGSEIFCRAQRIDVLFAT